MWLDGVGEFETSDGEVRQVSAGGTVLVEDMHGKGQVSRHPVEGQSVILITLPEASICLSVNALPPECPVTAEITPAVVVHRRRQV